MIPPMRTDLARLVTFAAIPFTMLAAPQAAIAQSQAACERLASMALPNATITLAQVVPAGLPPDRPRLTVL